MGEASLPHQGPARVRLDKEYEDNHFHDEDEVALPSDEGEVRPARPRITNRPSRKLPPRPRRFHED